MSREYWPDWSPWKRRPLTIPPNSLDTWIRLAVWELWMGMLLCVTLGLGVSLIVTSPDQIVSFVDISSCYAPPPLELPCERIVYRGGVLNAAFTALFGLMLIAAAAWFLWELWSAVEPKPITDDFLRLLHNSFGPDWRNPLTWPWARLWWAYGLTVVGAAMTAGAGLIVWALITSSSAAKEPTVRIETSHTFRLVQ